MLSGKKELFMLMASFALYAFDIISDVYVAAVHLRNGDYAWFSLTMLFIILPFIVVNAMAFDQIQNDEGKINRRRTNENDEDRSNENNNVAENRANENIHVGWHNLNRLLCCFNLIIFLRFFKLFSLLKRVGEQHNYQCERGNESPPRVDDITRYYRSAQRLLWILYVKFPWHTIVSNIFSLLSLAWNRTAFEKARLRGTENQFKTIAIGANFLSELFVMLMRVSAIASFAYSTQLFIFLPVVLHLFLVFVYLQLSPLRRHFNLGWIAVISFPFLFHASRPICYVLDIFSNKRYIIFYTTIGLESAGLSVISFFLKFNESDNECTAVTIALCVVMGSLFLASVFSRVYGCFLEVSPTSNNNNVEGEGNGQNNRENAAFDGPTA